jgi:hypothetical protein
VWIQDNSFLQKNGSAFASCALVKFTFIFYINKPTI